MNILFLTLLDFNTLAEKNIYTDLLRQFAKSGHNTVVVSPRERRLKEETHLIQENNCQILKLKIGNIQKTGIIEKGISTILLEHDFKRGIKKYFSDVKFDLVLYSTPPITLSGVVKYIKKRDNAKSYLLLKDIFPQNAVDIGMLSKSGLKGLLYQYFRSKEKQLYRLSDFIGCMSQANVDYILKNNPEIPPEKIHVCPNSIEVRQMPETEGKDEMRRKYGIPLDKTVFIYGGNLGKPQDIPFIIECLKANEAYNDRFFVICGTGTEYPKLRKYMETSHPQNVLLMNGLPKNEYDAFVGCCDVGLIFLDHRFTIPNYPSRILSYMENEMPVVVCADDATDIGIDAEKGGYGYTSSAKDVDSFTKAIDKMNASDIEQMGKTAREYLKRHFDAHDCYNTIMGRCKQ